MKKIIFTLFLFAFAITTKAQLANTKWKGTIQADESIDVVFHFANDTLKVINISEATTIETMTYKIKNDEFTLKKIEGDSECDATTLGQYKYKIMGGEIVFTLVADDCQQRAAILNNSKWTKVE